MEVYKWEQTEQSRAGGHGGIFGTRNVKFFNSLVTVHSGPFCSVTIMLSHESEEITALGLCAVFDFPSELSEVVDVGKTSRIDSETRFRRVGPDLTPQSDVRNMTRHRPSTRKRHPERSVRGTEP